ncbi:MAG TPA: PLDc N-terminal domain-containing protein [archaeon]|nr:PLDc N-terminal domain-containing protein [archaeon]
MALLETILGILALVAAIWVIYDVFTNNKKLKTEMKILWTVLAIVFNIITAIVYYFMYKRK